MKSLLLGGFVIIILWLPDYAQPNITLQQFASGFLLPTDIASAGDERLFVTEMRGTVRIINEDGNIVNGTFLDIRDRVTRDPLSLGLLGIAFHPDYANNGHFYVHYVDTNGNSRISRFTVNPADPNSAIASSEENLIFVQHPENGHYGGDLAFGNDGYLYFTIGDGHTRNNPGEFAQDTRTLLGKICRIDVDTAHGYRIPLTNPFVNDSSISGEIWNIGLRNPWRLSFDRHTGDLWISDVGEHDWEEINFQPAGSAGGENYGWPCFEGNSAFNPAACNSTGYTFPVYDYANPVNGCSVIGGYVYRGCEYPQLYGYYVFADYCNGKLFTLHDSSGIWVKTTHGHYSPLNFGTFGEDNAGELYIAGVIDGKIYRITENSPITEPVITVNDTLFCPDDSVLLTSSLPVSGVWELNGTPIAMSEQLFAKDEGVYKLRATWNGNCTATSAPVTLRHLPQPTPVINAAVTSFCDGEFIALSAGDYPYYEWSDGSTASVISIAAGGSFFVQVTDSNGCTEQSPPVEIIKHLLPKPNLVPEDNIEQCGKTPLIVSTGNNFSSYQWSTGDTTNQITVNESGIYNVTVHDANGCTGEADGISITFFQLPPTPEIQLDSLSLAAIPDGFTYQWFNNGNLLSTEMGQYFADYKNYSPGEFTVSITDSNGCSSLSAPVTLTWDTLPIQINKIFVFPNPFDDAILISGVKSDDFIITLTDITGMEIQREKYTYPPAGEIVEIKTGKLRLQPGIYFVKVNDGKAVNTLRIFKL